MTSMTIMTGSTTRAVLLQLVRAPQQITPKENTVGIEAQHLVIIPFVNRPFARLGCTVQNQSWWAANYTVGLLKQRKMEPAWFELFCFEILAVYQAARVLHAFLIRHVNKLSPFEWRTDVCFMPGAVNKLHMECYLIRENLLKVASWSLWALKDFTHSLSTILVKTSYQSKYVCNFNHVVMLPALCLWSIHPFILTRQVSWCKNEWKCQYYLVFTNRLCFVGHYIYLETSRPVDPGWKARLVSKYIGMRVACLKFWYHAFGDDAHLGELQLVVKTSTVGTVSLCRGWGLLYEIKPLKETNLGVIQASLDLYKIPLTSRCLRKELALLDRTRETKHGAFFIIISFWSATLRILWQLNIVAFCHGQSKWLICNPNRDVENSDLFRGTPLLPPSNSAFWTPWGLLQQYIIRRCRTNVWRMYKLYHSRVFRPAGKLQIQMNKTDAGLFEAFIIANYFQLVKHEFNLCRDLKTILIYSFLNVTVRD